MKLEQYQEQIKPFIDDKLIRIDDLNGSFPESFIKAVEEGRVRDAWMIAYLFGFGGNLIENLNK